MTNKTVHIISHTHWDREWYLPYETHHMLLVKVMDQLIETLENDPNYKSFHLDGQTIMLDDYLQVRPHMRDKIKQFVEEGRMHVGPWYILQDEFLTSSESNIRNLQYGLKDAKEWGNVSKVGYFPDSFGNMGQAPQILQQAGIKHAVFGRGVKPTGFNNTVIESDSFESPYSEMVWNSPDGSSVYGILFANWYCNGNEVPTNEAEAKPYWTQRLEGLEKYASSPHMLLMNGCDHQPIQQDLSKAIDLANDMYPEINFKHSNFNDYIEALTNTLPDDLTEVNGELRSQKTDGWGTLVNTASARMYLKQMNRKVETMLEQVAEPLATFAHLSGHQYDHDIFEYAWKTLMQNHPHDSICGCSVDEVHRENVSRFEKAEAVAKSIIDETSELIVKDINVSNIGKDYDQKIPFTVFNTSGHERSGVVSVVVDMKRQYFEDGVNRKALKEFPLGKQVVIDEANKKHFVEVEDLGITFGYDLPDDKFRQPYMTRQARITFNAKEIPALGYKTFALVKDEQAFDKTSLFINENEIENDNFNLKIEENGTYTVTDKETSRCYKNLGIYEDTGDIGSEYMYKQPNGEKPLTTENVKVKTNVIEDTPIRAVIELTHEWELPKEAEALLDEEQEEVIWFTERNAKRIEETVPFIIKTKLTIDKEDAGIAVTTSFNNVAKDHRLRVLFPTDISCQTHEVDSIFEVAERQIQPDKAWTNPDNSQHQQKFVSVINDTEGLAVANKGLNEYEILRDGHNTIAITLVRSVREMGDWGYFPTPEAQCQGDQTVEYKIYPFKGETDKLNVYQAAYQYQIPWTIKQVHNEEGNLKSSHSFLDWHADSLSLTSFKVSHDNDAVVSRWFNMSKTDETIEMKPNFDCKHQYVSNVLEEKVEKIEHERSSIKPYEIYTARFE